MWAYAYEIENDSLVQDSRFDAEALAVDTSIKTGNRKLDNWFKKHFQPDTGMWIHNHPEKHKIAHIYKQIKERRTMQETIFEIQKKGDLTPKEKGDLANKIMADIDRVCIEMYDDGHRKHLGASIIGDSCKRKLWYGFKWVKKITHDPRMYRLWNRGHKEELRFIEWLTKAGLVVTEIDPATGKQYRFKDVGGHFGGSMDGIVEFPEGYSPIPRMLLEFKTSGQKYFKKLTEEGVELNKEQHYAQMCTYGKRYNLEYALYLSVNKDTDEIYPEIVWLDWNMADKMTEKATEIIGSFYPPKKLSEDPSYWKCRFCDFAGVCHNGMPYDKNCRSCLYSIPVDNGQWMCNVHKQVLDEQTIEQGCGQWTAAKS